MVDRPSKWQQTWNILSPYVTEPINAMQRLKNCAKLKKELGKWK